MKQRRGANDQQPYHPKEEVSSSSMTNNLQCPVIIGDVVCLCHHDGFIPSDIWTTMPPFSSSHITQQPLHNALSSKKPQRGKERRSKKNDELLVEDPFGPDPIFDLFGLCSRGALLQEGVQSRYFSIDRPSIVPVAPFEGNSNTSHKPKEEAARQEELLLVEAAKGETVLPSFDIISNLTPFHEIRPLPSRHSLCDATCALSRQVTKDCLHGKRSWHSVIQAFSQQLENPCGRQNGCYTAVPGEGVDRQAQEETIEQWKRSDGMETTQCLLSLSGKGTMFDAVPPVVGLCNGIKRKMFEARKLQSPAQLRRKRDDDLHTKGNHKARTEKNSNNKAASSSEEEDRFLKFVTHRPNGVEAARQEEGSIVEEVIQFATRHYIEHVMDPGHRTWLSRKRSLSYLAAFCKCADYIPRVILEKAVTTHRSPLYERMIQSTPPPFAAMQGEKISIHQVFLLGTNIPRHIEKIREAIWGELSPSAQKCIGEFLRKLVENLWSVEERKYIETVTAA